MNTVDETVASAWRFMLSDVARPFTSWTQSRSYSCSIQRPTIYDCTMVLNSLPMHCSPGVQAVDQAGYKSRQDLLG